MHAHIIVCLVGAFLQNGIADNTVRPNCAESEGVCKISLSVSQLMTMTYMEHEEHVNIVIIHPNGTASKRSQSGCDQFRTMTAEGR